jgi:hypothetical protein
MDQGGESLIFVLAFSLGFIINSSITANNIIKRKYYSKKKYLV